MSDNFRETNYPEVDIDKIMEQIREEVTRRRGERNKSSHNDEPVRHEKAFIDASEIMTIISSAESIADISLMTPKMLQFSGLTRRLAVFTGKKILYLSTFITAKQRSFNITIIHALRTITDTLTRLGNDIFLRIKNETDDNIEPLKKDIGSINTRQTDMSSTLEGLTGSQAETAALLKLLKNGQAETGNILQNLMNEQAETASSLGSIRKEQAETGNILQNLMNEQAETSSALGSIRKEQAETISSIEGLRKEQHTQLEEIGKNMEQIKSIVNNDDGSLEALYVSFEEKFRGSRENIKERVKEYLPYIKEVNAGTSDLPVLDIGCGRGEWLELLKDEGLIARGVDKNSIFVSQCSELGLDVTNEDIFVYINKLPDKSLGAVTGFHIIEHLPFVQWIKLLDETVRVLNVGGVAIFETPNPQNVSVGSYSFYMDPTHRKPLPSQMIKFIAEARGLSSVKILELHPNPEAGNKSGSDTDKRFNEHFYGPQDYAVIGYKR